MRKFLTLTGVLFKNGSLFRQGAKKKRNLSLVIVAVALLPLLVTFTATLASAYPALVAAGMVNAVLAGLMTSACLAMAVLGIFYVISTYYFSDDAALLISMPIPSHQILAAKFVLVLVYQYLLEVLILLPGILAFGIMGGSLYYWLAALIVFLTLPLIPTVVCSIISILLMAFGNIFRNKDRVKLITGIVAIAAAIGVNLGLQSMRGDMLSSAISASGAAMQQAAGLYPASALAANGLLLAPGPAVLQLLLFLVISALCVALFLLLGNALYLRGVVSLTQVSVSKKRKANDERTAGGHSSVVSIALQEWRTLYRTPAYLINCVLGSILVPPLITVLLGLSLPKQGLTLHGPMALAIMVLALGFVGTVNAVSSTSVSREGKTHFVSRYLPVPYRTQIRGKLLPGLVLSALAVLLALIPATILFGGDAFTLVSGLVIGLVAVAAFNMLGLFVDIVFPKLEWDDETAAVKRNLNVVILMFAQLLPSGLAIWLVGLLKLDVYTAAVFLLAFYLALLTVSAALLFERGPALYAGETFAKKSEQHKDPRKLITTVITTVFVVAFAAFMLLEFTAKTQVAVAGSEVKITSGVGEGYSFPVSDIKQVYLGDSMPAASGRVGFASGNELRGSFNVEGLGRGHVYTQTAQGPFLFVILNDGSFAIFNYTDASKTNALYDMLKVYAKE